jgi:zinc transport system substrate-binding protein
MELTRRALLAGVAGTSVLAGCLGGDSGEEGPNTDRPIARSTFFVFGDITANVAGDRGTAELLVPVGQHGHGWEPGVKVREEIRGSDLLVHGMEGFQPWVDTIKRDLDADDAAVQTVDVSAGLDLLDPPSGTSHDDDGHDEGEDGDGHGDGMDPHFWLDPLRVSDAVSNVRQGLVDVDPDNEDAYADNVETFQGALDDLHRRIESVVADGSTDVLLVAGHNSFQYFGDRYGIEVEALTNVSPDDRPTTRDIQRAREVIETHGLRYICADPLESQQAAEQLVAETSAEAVLPLTAMPGLTDRWDGNNWGYVDIMKNVNLPTLEDALET